MANKRSVKADSDGRPGVTTRVRRLEFRSHKLGRFAIEVDDERDYVEAPGNSLLPRRFRVDLMEKASGSGGREYYEATIRLTIEVVDGLPTCRAIESRSARPLTTTRLRELNLGRVVEEASVAVALRLDRHGRLAEPRWGGKEALDALKEQYRAAEAEQTRRSRRDGLTVQHLRRVAELYRAAEADGCGDEPAKYVANELGIPRGKARRHIMRARELGLLGPAQNRRPGELAPMRTTKSASQ